MQSDDREPFETIAITWSQPEAAVMLALLAFNDIPAYAVGKRHAAVQPTMTVTLQGIGIRVMADFIDEALDIFAKVAEQPIIVRPYLFGRARYYRGLVALAALLLGIATAADDPSLFVAASSPMALLLAAAPPTRTPAELLFWKRRRRAG